MEKQAIIYARVSSVGDRQDTEYQVINLQKFAKANDYNVVKIVEEHVSGAKYTKDREFQKVYEFAKKNKCTILVSELSRIGRDSADVVQTAENCRKEKINIYLQDKNCFMFNDDGSENLLFDMILYVGAMFAKSEREKIKYRLNAGLQHYKDNGGKVGRKQGYKESKEKLLKKPGYEKAVKLIRAGRSYSSIIAELKGQDTPVKITKPTLIKLKRMFVKE